MLRIFPCCCWPYLSSLEKCLFRSSAHFFFFFLCWSYLFIFIPAHFLSGSGFLILSYMNSLYINLIIYIICKYIILFSRLPFHSVDGFPHHAKDQLPFIFVIVFLVWRDSQKNIVKTNSPCFLLGVLFYGFWSNIYIFNPSLVYFYK